jgi:hypothetical protein
VSGYGATVAGSGQRPLLFLDVDGPLIPFGAPPQQYQIYWTDHELKGAGSNPLLARLNPDHGSRLTALPCELVWATGWRAGANDCIAPLLGLPLLPMVAWPEPSELDEQDERNGLHWKTRALLSWAAGRLGGRSPGSMMRSPPPIGPGWPLTTQQTPYSIGSTLARDSPIPTTAFSTSGYRRSTGCPPRLAQPEHQGGGAVCR